MIVLDISAAITRALPSQTTPTSEALFARDPTPRLVAPTIFEAEASNALLRAARQGRFEPERVEAAIRDLMMTVALRIGGTASEVRALAWAERISFFDACCLDLAMREAAPLASRAHPPPPLRRDRPYLRLMTDDPERNRLSARAGRVASLGANFAGVAATAGVSRLFGGDVADRQIAQALKAALGRTKGPVMKVAQMLATIPDFLPPEMADELSTLQMNAPSMGWPFVQRRMRAELGADWETKFGSFEREAAHAASLGQVHRATDKDGRPLACKLQYPEMASAVEADIAQLQSLIGIVKATRRVIDPTEIGVEIADRLREELDYTREAKHMALYRIMLEGRDIVVPEPIPELSTSRLLTMTWLEGAPIKSFFSGVAQEDRNRLAKLLFHAWWGPMAHHGVIHGDPHLGNYTFADDGHRLNLLDFGAIRIFPASFVAGVVRLYRALDRNDMDAVRVAYEDWGFKGLNDGAVEALTIWARFIYATMLEDRTRRVAEGVAPGAYGRAEIMEVKRRLREHGPVTIPREFVFMDRAAIGLGAAFLRLDVELNFRRLFEDEIDGFDEAKVATRQAEAMSRVGLSG